MSAYIALVKRDFVAVSGDDEEVIPGNIGALKFGLLALQREDSQDNVRAEEYWQRAKALLSEETEDDAGPGALGRVMVSDDLDMHCVGEGL